MYFQITLSSQPHSYFSSESSFNYLLFFVRLSVYLGLGIESSAVLELGLEMLYIPSHKSLPLDICFGKILSLKLSMKYLKYYGSKKDIDDILNNNSSNNDNNNKNTNDKNTNDKNNNDKNNNDKNNDKNNFYENCDFLSLIATYLYKIKYNNEAEKLFLGALLLNFNCSNALWNYSLLLLEKNENRIAYRYLSRITENKFEYSKSRVLLCWLNRLIISDNAHNHSELDAKNKQTENQRNTNNTTDNNNINSHNNDKNNKNNSTTKSDKNDKNDKNEIHHNYLNNKKDGILSELKNAVSVSIKNTKWLSTAWHSLGHYYHVRRISGLALSCYNRAIDTYAQNGTALILKSMLIIPSDDKEHSSNHSPEHSAHHPKEHSKEHTAQHFKEQSPQISKERSSTPLDFPGTLDSSFRTGIFFLSGESKWVSLLAMADVSTHSTLQPTSGLSHFPCFFVFFIFCFTLFIYLFIYLIIYLFIYFHSVYFNFFLHLFFLFIIFLVIFFYFFTFYCNFIYFPGRIV